MTSPSPSPRSDTSRGLFFAAGIAIASCTVWFRVASDAPRPNVVIVTLDTTRLDRLSAYGYMSARQPTLDRLSREGLTFDRATTVAPLTLPAHTSLFTGLLPPRHGVRDNADPPLDAAIPTLAETLQRAGYRTGAFVASVVVGPERGLARGFERYTGGQWDRERAGLPAQRRADEVIRDAIDWLDDVAGEPFLMWAHLYDAHRPYMPPAPYDNAGDPYLGEIAFADSALGRLLEAIDARGVGGRTVVLVMADHGEALGDHGERDHGIFLYEAVMRVPMFMRVPGIAPRRIDGAVRITDVMPTLLALADVPAPAADGRSLVDLLHGREAGDDVDVYTESLYPMRLGWSPLRAISDGRFKLIEAPRPELYDLATDPFEERNLYRDRPQLAAALAARLIETAGKGVDATASAPLSTEQRDRLAALGYVASAPRAALTTSSRLPDPKDCIGAYRAAADTAGDGAPPVRPQCVPLRSSSPPQR
ncbi:MAG TPA: sulfatase [Vicinamibacterales bacterium]|nr:sulfatase [Vicinamibacterales bacterium]